MFDGLNDKQKEAAKETEGRIRIVAGAGTGKTKTLASRYAFLVNGLGIDPSNILCLTFTNKAAKEMTSRIAQIVKKGSSLPTSSDYVCTIHGFCVKFLRKEIFRLGFPKSFTILDVEDCKQMVSEILAQTGVDTGKKSLQTALNEVAARKGSGAYVEEFMTPQSPKINIDDTRDLPLLFIAQQLRLFALDFDDLIHFSIHILHTFPDVLKEWQDELQYIMVDEAQDLNAQDHHLIELLSAKHNNLFLVGDADQAIYEWRGANPGMFVNFACDKTIILDENYRSTPGILKAANSVIAHNKNRIDKNLFTNALEGAKIIHYHGKSEEEEARWIAAEIAKKIKDNSSKYSDFAIVYRSSYLSRYIEQSLLKHSIPYVIWGGIRFFERREIKDALSYLRLIETGDDLSFCRICNVPPRKFGKTTLGKLKNLASLENAPLYDTLVKHIDDKEFNKTDIKNFINIIEEIRLVKDNNLVSIVLDKVLKDSGLTDMIRREGDDERIANLSELMSSIKYYEQEKEDSLSLFGYLQDIALYTNADYKTNNDNVKLMTIHQSKGLEFPHVFIVGLNDGIFPNQKSIKERKEKAEEEERRLMYVAITRAKQTLYLTESEGYNINTDMQKIPSRYLLEMEKSLYITEGKMDETLWQMTKNMVSSEAEIFESQSMSDELEIGDQVEHEVFGDGEILDILKEKESVKVSFSTGIVRTLRVTFIRKKNSIRNDN